MYRLLKKDLPFKFQVVQGVWWQSRVAKLKKAIRPFVASATRKTPTNSPLVDPISIFDWGVTSPRWLMNPCVWSGTTAKPLHNKCSHRKEWSQMNLELDSRFHALQYWRPFMRGARFPFSTGCIALISLAQDTTSFLPHAGGGHF